MVVIIGVGTEPLVANTQGRRCGKGSSNNLSCMTSNLLGGWMYESDTLSDSQSGQRLAEPNTPCQGEPYTPCPYWVGRDTALISLLDWDRQASTCRGGRTDRPREVVTPEENLWRRACMLLLTGHRKRENCTEICIDSQKVWPQPGKVDASREL